MELEQSSGVIFAHAVAPKRDELSDFPSDLGVTRHDQDVENYDHGVDQDVGPAARWPRK